LIHSKIFSLSILLIFLAHISGSSFGFSASIWIHNCDLLKGTNFFLAQNDRVPIQQFWLKETGSQILKKCLLLAWAEGCGGWAAASTVRRVCCSAASGGRA
jgi:hypothetical protein